MGAVQGDPHELLERDAALMLFRRGESLVYVEEFRHDRVVIRWLAGPAIAVLCCVVAAVLSLVALPDFSCLFGGVMTGFILLAGWSRLMVFGGAHGTRLFVTDQRVMLEIGIKVGLMPQSIELASIRDIRLKRSAFGERFRFAGLVFETDTAAVHVPAVRRAAEVRAAVLAAARAGAATVPSTSSGNGPVVEQALQPDAPDVGA